MIWAGSSLTRGITTHGKARAETCECDGSMVGPCDQSEVMHGRSGNGCGAAQLAVNGGAGDLEQLGELGLGELAGRVECEQVPALGG